MWQRHHWVMTQRGQWPCRIFGLRWHYSSTSRWFRKTRRCHCQKFKLSEVMQQQKFKLAYNIEQKLKMI
jgi:hypothetical protein